MLPEIHQALARLLHERGNIDPNEVEVLFDAPTRERTERLTRPAISVFLTGVQENTELRNSGSQTTRGNGQAERRLAPRRIDLRYVVSAVTTDHNDQHRLLWRALGTLLRYPQFPMELLPEGFETAQPPLTARVAQPDDTSGLSELWSGLGVPHRPAFSLILTAPLDLELVIRSPLVLTRTARYVQSGATDPVAGEFTTIGGVVTREGAPLSGVVVEVVGSAAPAEMSSSDGRYRLANVEAGPRTLRLTLPDGSTRDVDLRVPSERYDIEV